MFFEFLELDTDRDTKSNKWQWLPTLWRVQTGLLGLVHPTLGELASIHCWLPLIESFLSLACICQRACWQWVISIVNKLLFHFFGPLIAIKTMRTLERNDLINTYLACLDF